MVQFVNVAAPLYPIPTPPPYWAEFPLTVQFDSAVVPLSPKRPPPYWAAEFPLTVQLVSVVVPKLSRPPPMPVVLPPVIVILEREAVAPVPTRNTRLSPPP